MDNGALINRMFTIFAVAVFTCVFSARINLADEESDAGSDTQQQPAYTEYPGEIGDIAKRAEAQIKEINETSELEKEKLETVKREQHFEDYKEEPAVSLLSKDDIAELETKRAESENAIRTKVGYEIQSLEAEQTAPQGGGPAGSRPRTLSQISTRGIVTGIVFCNNRGAALVAGEIVRENDEVLDVKVVRITADFVEFEKQGNKWKQMVGQAPPASFWEQPQQSTPVQRPLTAPKAKPSR
jgi:hypothetical protein